jgi:hypothetical protein
MLAQFRWEGQQPLAAGKHTLVFDFKYDGPGIAKGGTGVLKVGRPGRCHTDDTAHSSVLASG